MKNDEQLTQRGQDRGGRERIAGEVYIHFHHLIVKHTQKAGRDELEGMFGRFKMFSTCSMCNLYENPELD